MATTKRNEWLDFSSDEESDADAGYDSEKADQKPALRSAKRRKLSSDHEDDGSESDDGVLGDTNAIDESDIGSDGKEENEEDSARHKQPSHKRKTRDHTTSSSPKPPSSKPKDVHTSKKKKKDPPKPGVIYISRIPPFMKPSTLRSLLSPAAPKHGLQRIFLTPEPPAAHAARVRSGGNKKRSFADGWVEFASRKEARRAAEALNARPVGGRRGGWYRDDVWNMRYLSGFGWSDLMAQARGDAAERAGRGRAEAAQAAREGAAFVAGVEKAKALKGIEAKRRAKRERDGVVEEKTEEGKPRATFRQSIVKDKRATKPVNGNNGGHEKTADAAVERVLGSIF